MPVKEEEKIQTSVKFIKQSPPGEFHEVLNDLRVLVENDHLLQQGIKEAIVEYNQDQFIVAPIEANKDEKVIVCKYNSVDGGWYVDNRLSKKFKFDHLLQKVSEVENADDLEKSEFDTKLKEYVDEHYPGGVSRVFNGNVFIIVGNKYNPANYWNGRWRSCYKYIDKKLTGFIKVTVHYYEDGNVLLDTDYEVAVDSVEKGDVVAKIKKIEEDYQNALNESYVLLGDGTFKGLRRVLPVTRNKLDWNKIMNYKVGSQIASTTGANGTAAK